MAERLPIPMPPLLPLVDPVHALERVVAYYVSRLQGLSSGDYVRGHLQADDLLCRFLWEVGYGEIADAYRDTCTTRRFSY